MFQLLCTILSPVLYMINVMMRHAVLCFSDRLIGDDQEVCDSDCVTEARVTGLTFAVGRLLHSITQTMQAAAEPDTSDLQARLLYTRLFTRDINYLCTWYSDFVAPVVSGHGSKQSSK